MSDRVAFVLGLLIATGIVLDLAVYGTGHVLFLAQKLYELIEWLAFWR